MDKLEKKRKMLSKKMDELPIQALQVGLNASFNTSKDLVELINNGLKSIKILSNLEQLSQINIEDAILVDLRENAYGKDLDEIPFAKHANENLCIISKDIILDDYQIYLSRGYQIDAIMFDISYIDKENLKNMIFLMEYMGITPIFGIKSEDDIQKIDWQIASIVSVYKSKLLSSISDNVKVIKDTDSDIDDAKADLVVY